MPLKGNKGYFHAYYTLNITFFKKANISRIKKQNFKIKIIQKAKIRETKKDIQLKEKLEMIDLKANIQYLQQID